MLINPGRFIHGLDQQQPEHLFNTRPWSKRKVLDTFVANALKFDHFGLAQNGYAFPPGSLNSLWILWSTKQRWYALALWRTFHANAGNSHAPFPHSIQMLLKRGTWYAHTLYSDDCSEMCTRASLCAEHC